MSLDYEAALDHHPECLLALDGDGCLIKLSAMGLRTLGATSFKQVRARPFYDFVPIKERPDLRELLARVFRGQAASEKFHLAGLQGGSRHVEIRAGPVRNAAGEIQALLGIVREIKPDACSDALMFRCALDQSADAVLISDDQFRLLYANDAACRSLGYERPELLSLTATGLNPNVTPVMLKRIRQKLDSIGRLPPVETLHRRRDGHVFPVEVTLSRVTWGNAKGILCVVRNLAPQKKRAAESRASDSFLKTLMEAAPDFIARYDLQCRRMAMNPAMQKLFDRPLNQILGHTPEELPLYNTRWFMEILRSVLNTGQPWRGEAAYTEAGVTSWGELRVIPEFDASHAVVGAISIWRDITRLRQLQDQLRQAQKLEALGQLVSGIAHDFNNMLAAILLHVSLLRTDPRLPPDLLTLFVELEEDARRATSLPRQLLVFSRQQAMQARAILLESVIGTTLKMLRRIVGEQIQIEFQPMRRPLYVFADPGMMEQIVLNLCLNARDAMPAGGRITLVTKHVEVDDRYASTVKGARPGQFVRFSVADTGCGMDAVTIARIFEPFFTTKESGRGTGLGLVTVFDIVQQHHGWIEVDSAVGRGSTFFIFLPVHSPDENPDSARNETLPVPQGAGETILVVEDEPSLRQVLAAMITRGGYRVLVAADGAEAAELWSKHHAEIELLFSDIIIPNSNGLALAKEFRKSKPSLKVILSSGYRPAADLAADCRTLGISFMSKPVLWEELAKTLAAALHPRP